MLKVTHLDIERLNPMQLAKLLQTLLLLEARKLQIRTSAVHVPLNITVADGGEDGRIDIRKCEGGKEIKSDFIDPGLNVFQAKAGDMPPAKCKEEILTTETYYVNGKDSKGNKKKIAKTRTILKSQVQKVVDADGCYVLFYNTTLNQQGIDNRIEKFEEAFEETEVDFPTEKIKIFDAQKICDWTNEFITSIVLVNNWLGKRMECGLKTWKEWNEDTQLSRLTFVQDDSLEKHYRDIRSYLSSKEKVVRISGKDGIGKTKLALKVFRQGSGTSLEQYFLSESCAYIDAIDAKELVSQVYTWYRQNLIGTLVVDNCNLELHNRLREIVIRTDCKLKLVTIGHEVTFKEDKVVHLAYCSEQVIREIIQQIHPKLSRQDLEKIIHFSNGIPKIAIMLADGFLKERDLSRLDSFEITQRLLWGTSPRNEEAHSVISAISLFSYVGFLDEFSNQYQFVAKNICKMSDPYKFYSLAKRYFGKQGVICEQGRFIKVFPETIANDLAINWWHESHPQQQKEIVTEILCESPLLEPFLLRLKQLYFVPQVKEITKFLCTNCLNRNPNLLLKNSSHHVVLDTLVEIDSISVTKFLKSFFEQISDEQIEKIDRSAFRYFMLIFEKASFWSENFETCVYILLRLVKIQKGIELNEVRTPWKTFAGLFLPNAFTQTPLMERIEVLKKLLSSSSVKHIFESIRLSLASYILFPTPYSKLQYIGPEQQGNRAILEGLNPTTKEVDEYTKMISTLLLSSTEYNEIKKSNAEEEKRREVNKQQSSSFSGLSSLSSSASSSSSSSSSSLSSLSSSTISSSSKGEIKEEKTLEELKVYLSAKSEDIDINDELSKLIELGDKEATEIAQHLLDKPFKILHISRKTRLLHSLAIGGNQFTRFPWTHHVSFLEERRHFFETFLSQCTSSITYAWAKKQIEKCSQLIQKEMFMKIELEVGIFEGCLIEEAGEPVAPSSQHDLSSSSAAIEAREDKAPSKVSLEVGEDDSNTEGKDEKVISSSPKDTRTSSFSSDLTSNITSETTGIKRKRNELNSSSFNSVSSSLSSSSAELLINLRNAEGEAAKKASRISEQGVGVASLTSNIKGSPIHSSSNSNSSSKIINSLSSQPLTEPQPVAPAKATPS